MIATSLLSAPPLAAPALESVSFARRFRQIFDHGWRTTSALRGFTVYGVRWLRPWLAYAASPLLRRIFGGRTMHFREFGARLDQCDLYTFANVFADYPMAELKRALPQVQLIIDLGANVGAFSYLARQIARKQTRPPRIIALEPDPANCSFLRQQPFAKEIEVHQQAVASVEGIGSLISGENSVTHRVDVSSRSIGLGVPLVTLASLCSAPALVKMDIEGGELDVLSAGLPDQVRFLVLEWHGYGTPADVLPGNWRRLSRDMDGATTWWFSR
jgi:FkbM family methyltransferase